MCVLAEFRYIFDRKSVYIMASSVSTKQDVFLFFSYVAVPGILLSGCSGDLFSKTNRRRKLNISENCTIQL